MNTISYASELTHIVHNRCTHSWQAAGDEASDGSEDTDDGGQDDEGNPDGTVGLRVTSLKGKKVVIQWTCAIVTIWGRSKSTYYKQVSTSGMQVRN